MNEALARACMTLAAQCLGASRREWVRAMRAEYEIAHAAGRPLGFAAGCLVAALRELPRHGEGRLALANHGLAAGILVPVAALQLICAMGVAFPVGAELHGAPLPGSAAALYLSRAYLSAVPLMLGIWLALGLAQLRLTWALLDGDWPRVVRLGALMAAATLSLLMFDAVLFIDDARTLAQAATLLVELAAVAALARWQARRSGGEELALPAL